MPPLQCQLETTPLETCTANVHQLCMHDWRHTFSSGLWPLMCIPAVMGWIFQHRSSLCVGICPNGCIALQTLLCCLVRSTRSNKCISYIHIKCPAHLEADSWSSICRFCRLSCMRWKVPSGPMPMAMLKLSPWMVTAISSSSRWSTQLMSRLPKLRERYRALPLLSSADASPSTASSPFGPVLPTTANQKAHKVVFN